MEVRAQILEMPRLHGQILVAEPVDAREHAGEYLVIESRIICRGPEMSCCRP
jgi:hypothetical protein